MKSKKSEPKYSRMRMLKDFQRKTVNYVFRRLYTDRDRVNRFLIADEAGAAEELPTFAVDELAGEARAHAERLPPRVRVICGELPPDAFGAGVVILASWHLSPAAVRVPAQTGSQR